LRSEARVHRGWAETSSSLRRQYVPPLRSRSRSTRNARPGSRRPGYLAAHSARLRAVHLSDIRGRGRVAGVSSFARVSELGAYLEMPWVRDSSCLVSRTSTRFEVRAGAGGRVRKRPVEHD